MYKISGEVIHGKKRGRIIGFPTANIYCDSQDIDTWTYALNIEYEQKLYAWVGVYMKDQKLFEAHLLDFNTEIYGENIVVYVLWKLRENKKFDGIEDIKQQIQKDIELRQSTVYNVLTFWSFDHVHEGHKYYLQEAKKYGDTLITVVASDKNILKIKWKNPKYTQTHRVQHIQDIKISGKVIPGSEENPLKWLEIYKPSSICLWYDQRWPFLERLWGEVMRLWLATQIIRIDPHYPEKYKSSLLKK